MAVDIEQLRSIDGPVEVLLAVLDDEPPILLAALLTEYELESESESEPDDAPVVAIIVDDEPVEELAGRRLELHARDEIVIACGAARLTLRRNGRVTIRGAHIDTHASGVNRIKGASVQIN